MVAKLLLLFSLAVFGSARRLHLSTWEFTDSEDGSWPSAVPAMTEADAASLVGVWKWKRETVKTLSLNLMKIEAQKQMAASGRIDTAKMFAAGASYQSLLALIADDAPSGMAPTVNTSWYHVTTGVDAVTGAYAGMLIMMDSSGDVPIIYNVRDVIGVATKGANSTMQMTGNDNTPELIYELLVKEGKAQMRGQVKDAEGDGKGASFLLMAQYEKETKWSVNAVVNAVYKLKSAGTAVDLSW